jgi:hypothetical protein
MFFGKGFLAMVVSRAWDFAPLERGGLLELGAFTMISFLRDEELAKTILLGKKTRSCQFNGDKKCPKSRDPILCN